MEHRLILAQPLPLNAVADQPLPKRVKLLGWGTNATNQGPVIVDDTTVRVFSANQKLLGRECVPVDFEHNTVPGTPEYKRTQEPRPVAGHSNLVCVPNDGIYAEGITYTATGETHGRNYKDVSLAPWLDKSGRVVGAHSWALTQTGSAYGFNFEDAAATLSAQIHALSSNQPNPTMTEKFLSLNALSALLGLGTDADETAVTAELKKRLTAQPPTTLSAADITAALKPLTDKFTALETKLLDGEKATAEAERAKLVPLFAQQGKVPLKADSTAYTQDELKELPTDTLQLLLANTAVTVPLSARNAAHQTENAAKKYRVKVNEGGKEREVIDLGKIFDDEAAARGLTAMPSA